MPEINPLWRNWLAHQTVTDFPRSLFLEKIIANLEVDSSILSGGAPDENTKTFFDVGVDGNEVSGRLRGGMYTWSRI